jgi:hypothetical protein
MHNYGAKIPDALPFRQGLRHQAEIHGRTALPFHHTPHPGGTHDLLVMNPWLDPAPAATVGNDRAQPDGERPAS